MGFFWTQTILRFCNFDISGPPKRESKVIFAFFGTQTILRFCNFGISGSPQRESKVIFGVFFEPEPFWGSVILTFQDLPRGNPRWFVVFFFWTQIILWFWNFDISPQREQHPPWREGNKSLWFCLGSLPAALNISTSLYLNLIWSLIAPNLFSSHSRPFQSPSWIFPTLSHPHYGIETFLGCQEGSLAKPVTVTPAMSRLCHHQPHSSGHQRSVGTNSWPRGSCSCPGQFNCIASLFLRIHPTLYWVICPVFVPPVTPRQLPPLVVEKITVIKWESLNCSIHYPQESFPTGNLFAWELPKGFLRFLA